MDGTHLAEGAHASPRARGHLGPAPPASWKKIHCLLAAGGAPAAFATANEELGLRVKGRVTRTGISGRAGGPQRAGRVGRMLRHYTTTLRYDTTLRHYATTLRYDTTLIVA